MATHSCILLWRIPWTEEPGGLQSIESYRVGHERSDLILQNHFNRWIHGKFENRTLVGCIVWLSSKLNFSPVLVYFITFRGKT